LASECALALLCVLLWHLNIVMFGKVFAHLILSFMGDSTDIYLLVGRFDEIEKKIIPFLKACGYNVKKGVLLCMSFLHFLLSLLLI
jgi:hypothetical protein